MKNFEMSNLGVLSYFIGIEIMISTEGVVVHKRKYARNILKRSNMQHSKPVTTHIICNIGVVVHNKLKNITIYHVIIFSNKLKIIT
jgi:hypothetical protein